MNLDTQTAAILRSLLLEQPIAALGTVSGGNPRVSMVVCACSRDGSALYLHVSHLSEHTREMLEHPMVSLLITETPRDSRNPLSLARLSVQGVARAISPDDEEYQPARSIYLARHPGASITFQLGDFVLFAIRPVSARLVAGFARAFDISSEAISDAIQ